MIDADSKPPCRKDALDIVDAINQRLIQAGSICALAGLAEIPEIPKNTLLHSMWAVGTLIDESMKLVSELHKLQSAAGKLEVVK